ncbi:kinesin-like protein Klp8 [Rhizophlyctis rosea]|uniref:Kinesin-like protein Klp8 n=1 Tax=Rhizophlyctis rosea TaxID=64517 RepID=A0AAD5SI25_9FUNG|nr:kinesin-like protein Klp8 [Rhizophlyctis rosea]
MLTYGQTGSGKSYTMMGYKDQKGIIPRACDGLFSRIKSNKDPNLTFNVEVSYLEIYNEKVRDLINPNNKGNLRVREHPLLGPYVEDLTKLLVGSYDDIAGVMEAGNRTRTVASTNMNETSSRSHAVFTVILSQRRRDPASEMESHTVSRICLVDLAGSERADATGATGARLKEGANINKSLTTLGKVISSLADASSSEKTVGRRTSDAGLNSKRHTWNGPPQKTKKSSAAAETGAFIPYRDSTLTWLLKDCLGGNSKTVMIAAISPADVNYEETLSTLRYAERAKKIVNKAVVNEDENGRVMRELQQELVALREKLKAYEEGQTPKKEKKVAEEGEDGGEEEGGLDSEVEALVQEQDEQISTLVDQLQASEKLMVEITESYEQKLRKAEEIQSQREQAYKSLGISLHVQPGQAPGVAVPKRQPHLVNLNEDPLMSECLLYQLPPGITEVGDRADAAIPLTGEFILSNHCQFETDENGSVLLHVEPGALVYVNGRMVVGSKRLRSGFRIIIGENHVFRFNNPEEVRKERRRSFGIRRPLTASPTADAEASFTRTSIDDTRCDTPDSSAGSTSSEISVPSGIIDWNFAQREKEIAHSSRSRGERPLSYASTTSGGYSDEAYETLSEVSLRLPQVAEMQMQNVIRDLEERMKNVRDNEMQRILEENLEVSREIAKMEMKLEKDREKLKEMEEIAGRGEVDVEVTTLAHELSNGDGMEVDRRDEMDLLNIQEELRAERERVLALEEDIRLEKERMQRTLELQRLNYEAKLRRVSKRSRMSPPVPSFTSRERSLASDVVAKWKNRNFVMLAKEILTGGVALKEANIIARELRKDVGYEFVVLGAYPPISFWEAPALARGSSSDRGLFSALREELPGVKGRPFLAVRVLDGRNNSVYFWSFQELQSRLARMRSLYNIADRPRDLLAQAQQRTLNSQHANGGPFFGTKAPWFDFIGTGFVSMRCLVSGVTREVRCPILVADSGRVKGFIRVVVSPIGSERLVNGSLNPSEDDDDDDFSGYDTSPGDGEGEAGGNVGAGAVSLRAVDVLQVGADLLFEVNILDIEGISENEYTQVHVQFRVGGLGDEDEDEEEEEGPMTVSKAKAVHFASPEAGGSSTADSERVFATDPITDFGDRPAMFGFSQTVRLKVTPKVRDAVMSGTVRFEVFGRRQVSASELIKRMYEPEAARTSLEDPIVPEAIRVTPTIKVRGPDSVHSVEPLSPSVESEGSGPSINSHASSQLSAISLPPSERHDILAHFQISEFSRVNGDFRYTPVESASGVNTFLLRQGLQRRLTLTLEHTSGKELPWDRLSEIRLGRIRRVDARGNDPDDDGNVDDAKERQMLPLLLPEKQTVRIGRDGKSTLEVECAWDSSLHESLHLNKVTKGNLRIVASLEWTVEMQTDFQSATKNAQTASSKLQHPLRFNMEFCVRVFERDFRVKAMTRLALMGLISGSGFGSKYSERLSAIYTIELSAEEKVQKSKCWGKLDTRGDYVRGEECLNGWKPGGQELVTKWVEARAREKWRRDVESVRALLEELGGLNGFGGKGKMMEEADMVEKRKVVAVSKCLDIWKRRDCRDFGLERLLTDYEDSATSMRSLSGRPAHQAVFRWIARIEPVLPGPVVRRGWLHMPEDGGDTWVKRWFVIRRPHLYIYSTNGETDLVGMVGLSDVTVQYTKDLWSILQRGHVFAIYTKYHSVLLQAASEDDMKEWVGAVDPLHVGAVLSHKGGLVVERDC